MPLSKSKRKKRHQVRHLAIAKVDQTLGQSHVTPLPDNRRIARVFLPPPRENEPLLIGKHRPLVISDTFNRPRPLNRIPIWLSFNFLNREFEQISFQNFYQKLPEFFSDSDFRQSIFNGIIFYRSVFCSVRETWIRSLGGVRSRRHCCRRDSSRPPFP